MKLAIFSFLAYWAACDAVCDKNTLINELKQDLADNNMLDCLRVIHPPHGVEESAEVLNKRLAAQWDSDCSFDGPDSWVEEMKKIHNIPYLVDNIGDVVEGDNDDQADMCEFIRAAFVANKFPKMGTVTNMNKDFLAKIDCAGHKSQTQPCAVNNESFFASMSWYILFDSFSITYKNTPKWKIEAPKIEKKEEEEEEPLPEDEEELTPAEKRKKLENANLSLYLQSAK